jgi:hypothetical protein
MQVLFSKKLKNFFDVKWGTFPGVLSRETLTLSGGNGIKGA